MLPLRVFERIVVVEWTGVSPVTRSVACTLPWREVKLAVGGTPFGERKHRLLRGTLPSMNVCTRSRVGSRGSRGSSDQDPACFKRPILCGRWLNIPWILSRFVYICRPLTGGIDGCSDCLFLGGEPDVEGAGGEYAGGSSPGTEGGYDGLLGTKEL